MKTINVSQEDISAGKPDSFGCPIALAAKRAFKEPFSVAVTSRKLFCGSMEMTLPNEAQEFIKRFDTGKEVQPFSFALDLV